MTSRLLPALLGALLLAAPAIAQNSSRTLTVEADGERRVALVLGNSDYTAAPKLRNAGNDAVDISAALQRVGFTVVEGIDLTQDKMDEALLDFRTAAQGADVAAFYYAGHGVQVAGENYLLPVDADLDHETQVKYKSLALSQVMDVLSVTRASLKIVVMDACRDNPFRSWRSSAGGLAQPTNPPRGSFISYATAPGAQASDNPTGRNGLFTAALLERMSEPGLELDQLFRQVGGRVSQQSNGAQEPWKSSSYTGSFYFVPPNGEAVGRVAPPAPRVPSGAPTAEQRDAAKTGAEAFHRRDYAAAAAPLRTAAEAGDAASQTLLGVMLQNGWAVREDAAQAARWYRPAAAGGDAVAQTNLGYLYQHGRGVPANAREAARLYQQAADQGRAAAQNNLAALYQHGTGVARDYARAVSLYRSAEAGGELEAQVNLAYMVEHGLGADADCDAARGLYALAADRGHTGAAERVADWSCGVSE